MKLEVIGGEFTVCKLTDASQVDLNCPFCFLSRTDAELSLVCPAEAVPANALAREDGWRMLRVSGTLDFSLTGILAGLTGVLARNGIAVFALSTFDTDYLLTKKGEFGRALELLAGAGYEVLRN